MKDIVSIGEILIDLTQCSVSPLGVPQFAANPGGAPANLAVAASRLGASTGFIGKVGADAFGTYLKSVLQENGVDGAGVVTDPTLQTTLAVVSLDSQGERSFSFYRNPSADVNLQPEDILLSLVQNTRILHFGSVSLTTEPCRSATLFAVQAAQKAGALVSYDPNYRAALWPDLDTAIAQMRAALSLADIVKLSEEELPLLSGNSDLELGTAQLLEAGVSLIFVTLGDKGAFFRLGQSTMGLVPSAPVQVADTNGAGDTFFGAALSRLAGKDFKALTAAELEDITRFANRAAGLTTSRSGAIPAMPTAEEMKLP